MLAFVTNPRPQVSLTTFSDSSVPVVLIDWQFAHCCGWSFIFDSFAWFATLTATGWKKKRCVGATALLGGSEDVGPIRVSFEGTVRWRSQWRSPYAVSSHFAGGFLQKSRVTSLQKTFRPSLPPVIEMVKAHHFVRVVSYDNGI